jgi:hypothetical protein
MKLSTSLSFRSISFIILLIFFISSSYAQVGINTTTPAEMLDVNGNVKIDGALMPNNLPGNSGQILTSAGVNNPPTWGADLTNVTDITRYTATSPIDLDPSMTYSFTVTIPGGSSTQSTAIVTIEGNWFPPIFGDLTIHHVEMRTNNVRFVISNNTPLGIGGVIYPTPAFNITIIR